MTNFILGLAVASLVFDRTSPGNSLAAALLTLVLIPQNSSTSVGISRGWKFYHQLPYSTFSDTLNTYKSITVHFFNFQSSVNSRVTFSSGVIQGFQPSFLSQILELSPQRASWDFYSEIYTMRLEKLFVEVTAAI